MGIGGGGSSGSSQAQPAGGGVLSGILNAAFGLDQTVRNGQFSLVGPEDRGAETITRLISPVGSFSSSSFAKSPELAGGAFGEGTPGFDLVSNLLKGITDPVAFGKEFEALVGQSVDAQQDIFGKSADALSQLISSGGNPTDVSGIVNQGVAQLKEQFSTSGAGLFSSDVQGSANRLTSELNVGAQESAQNRLLQALGLGQTFAQSGQRFASNLGTLGQQHEQLFTSGGRARGALQSLTSPGTNTFSIGSDSKNKAFNFNLGF